VAGYGCSRCLHCQRSHLDCKGRCWGSYSYGDCFGL